MDKDLERGESETAPIQASADLPQPEDEAETAGPVVLADAMCGAFCSIKGETRLA